MDAHALVLQFVVQDEFHVLPRAPGVGADHRHGVIVAVLVRVVLVGEEILICEADVIALTEEEEGDDFLEEMIRIHADVWDVSI